MLNVSITVTGLPQAQSSIANITRIMGDFSPETQQIGDRVKQYFQEDVYDSQGSVYGSAWAALSPGYAIRKAKEFGDQPILVASGKMRQSYQVFTTSDYAIIQNTAQDQYGNYYASGHQYGEGYLPQRLLMDINDELAADIGLLVTQSINERIFQAIV